MSIERLTLSTPGPTETQNTHITPFPPDNQGFLTAIFQGLQPDEAPLIAGMTKPVGPKSAPPATPWRTGVGADDPTSNWYFTLSTYRPDEHGRYRRTKARFHRAFGIYLDDVGTKAAPLSRLDGLPPSYVIETSPGNYQAGYLFDEPVAELVHVEALQKALIGAGLCDPGADGPGARIGRMPFAVNGKHTPPHPCRLVEWHPDRRYSIEQMVAGLELAPVAPAGTRPTAKDGREAAAIDKSVERAEADIYRPRAAENPVVAALRQRGLLKTPLGEGRHDITCPWVHEHTGGEDHGTAYFEPSDTYPVGGFKCLHSHGAHKRLGALIEFLGLSFTEAKHRPTIRVSAGELHRIVDAAERELAGGNIYYQRAGLIATVSTDPATGETRIKPTTANALMRALSCAAVWERYDARAEAFVPTDPPTKHVNILFDADSYAHLPVLHGIARQPYLRADGSLMRQSGYDPTSGMFGAFDERKFNVPAEPSQEDAAWALGELRELLAEFSFGNPTDEAGALAAILTATIRPSLPVAPMFHLKAPLPGSGKSYLSDLIASFAGPGKASAYAFPTSEEECSKLMLSALVEAPPVIRFDNLTTDLLAFKTLCAALTEPTVTDRLLGFSKTVTAPTQTLMMSSGNNVGPVRDMTRRVVVITLDPRVEVPAEREFKSDPVAVVQAERARYVTLALTIIRAYITAGCPPQKIKPLASYEQWSRLARAPLSWLGLPDAAASVFESMSTDPDRELLGRLLQGWHRVHGSAPMPVGKVIGGAVLAAAGLDETMREVAEERGEINRRRLGRWIARHQGRLVHGLKFTRDTPSGGVERWRVVSDPAVRPGEQGVMCDSGVSSGRHQESVSADVEVF